MPHEFLYQTPLYGETAAPTVTGTLGAQFLRYGLQQGTATNVSTWPRIDLAGTASTTVSYRPTTWTQGTSAVTLTWTQTTTNLPYVVQTGTGSQMTWLRWNEINRNQPCTPAEYDTWRQWNETLGNGVGNIQLVRSWAQWNEPIQQTFERDIAAALRNLWAQLGQASTAADEQAANERAEALLAQHLTPEQLRDLQERRCLYVFSQSGRRYRVDRGSTVKLLDDRGSILKRLCIHPEEHVPAADVMLCQKLLIEADEERLWRVANVS